MMPQLLVLADEESDLHRLRDRFASQYRFAVMGSDLSVVDDIDLYVVGSPVLSHYAPMLREAKQTFAPLFLPVLVVTAEAGEWEKLADFLDEIVDAVLLMPPDQELIGLSIRGLLTQRNLARKLVEQTQALSRINLALESTSDAISISDQNGTSIYQNQSFSDLYGFDIDDLVVRGVEQTMFTDPADAESVAHSLGRGDAWQGEVDLRRKDGQRIPTFVRINPIYDASGKNVGDIYVYTDIRDRRRAEDAEQEQRVFADALHDTAAALTSTLDLEIVLDRILHNILRVVPHDASSIMLMKDGTASVVRSQGYQALGVDQKMLESASLNVDEVAGLHWMADTGQPLIISDAYTYAGWFGKTGIPWLRAYLGSPIVLQGVTLGFLNINSIERGAFDVAQAARLQLFAEQAAIAIQNAQMHEKTLILAGIQERQRVARELHDGVNQLLFSASMIAESLLYTSDRGPESTQKRLARLHHLTRGALIQMRMLLAELRPEELIEARLSDLVRQMVAAVESRAFLQVDLTVDGDYRLPAAVQIAYYYIALELLNNVVSHAHATQLTVQLETTLQSARLVVTDDGKGFNPDRIAASQGGISTINERVGEIGATLDIDSQPGMGTQVTILWGLAERNVTHDPDGADTCADC